MIKIKTMCTRLCCVCALRLCMCAVLHRCCSVLCSVCCILLCSVFCIVEVYVLHICLLCLCIVCVHVCAGLCAYCVRIVCVLCACVRYPVEVSTQSDTPHVGYLCGYMVRIIKYKKTQPLIKLKSI